jgi:hypothetical protein
MLCLHPKRISTKAISMKNVDSNNLLTNPLGVIAVHDEVAMQEQLKKGGHTMPQLKALPCVAETYGHQLQWRCH